MQSALSIQLRGRDYNAFGYQVRADRPIPFEPWSGGDRDQRALILVENRQTGAKIPLGKLDCFHDAEDFPGGPHLRIFRSIHGFVVEHRDFVLRFLPHQNLIDYRLTVESYADFRFGLMVERVAVPLYLLLTRPAVMAIHGGAVTLDDTAWAFIGPSGVGKSTTARTLLKHGARLMTDDLALLEVGSDRMLPGCPAVRLWEEAGAVEQATHDTQLTEEITKRWYRIGSGYIEPEPTPLGGIIVLDPQPAAMSPGPFQFERLKGQEAFAAVMRQVFNFSDPEPTFAMRQFRNVKGLLATKPVIRYRYHRSQTREPTHVEPLLDYLLDAPH